MLDVTNQGAMKLHSFIALIREKATGSLICGYRRLMTFRTRGYFQKAAKQLNEILIGRSVLLLFRKWDLNRTHNILSR